MKMAYYLNKMKRTNKTAYESAIHLLNYRPQSEYELRTKLARKGYDPDEIGKVMDKLKHYGYLNDSELADDLFDSFRNRKCYGETYIHQKLKSRGLHTNKHLTAEEEIDIAVSLLEEKVRIKPELLINYRKAAAFLLRRGLSQSAVMTALREVRTFEYED